MKTTRAQRRRIVEQLRIEVPTAKTTKAQRRRMADLVLVQAGLPPRESAYRPRGRAEPIDMTELDGLRGEMEERARSRRQLLARLRLAEDRDYRIRCLACGDGVAFNPRGPVCAAPRAIAGAHAYLCTGRAG